MSGPGYKWECSFCTFTNLSHVQICEICGKTVVSNPKRAILTPPIPKATNSLESLKYLSLNGNECEICFDNIKNIIKIPHCFHRICYSCIRKHFSLTTSCNCPVCKYPSIKGTLINSTMDAYLKDLFLKLSLVLDQNHMKEIKIKLETRKLAVKPNFRRCCLCNIGFIWKDFTNILYCSSCRIQFCSSCQVQDKMKDHNCKTYKDNLLKQSPIEIFEIKNVIKCPTCQFHSILCGDGCLHVTCDECQEEYCSFCKAIFNRDKKRGLCANHSTSCWNF